MKLTRRGAIAACLLALFLLPPQAAYSAKRPPIIGAASWYGGKFHGRKTASGERYNKNALTAAHKSLPFGTKVRVTNQANGKSVVVRINDRGPYSGRRVIDLSRAAATAVGMLKAGVAKVKIEVL